MSNPKALLFFAAFLYLLLGTLFIGIDACVMLSYAAAGSQAVRWLSQQSSRAINRGCAVGMGVLAVTLAIWRRPGV